VVQKLLLLDRRRADLRLLLSELLVECRKELLLKYLWVLRETHLLILVVWWRGLVLTNLERVEVVIFRGLSFA
jgi:hypothetical protein